MEARIRNSLIDGAATAAGAAAVNYAVNRLTTGSGTSASPAAVQRTVDRLRGRAGTARGPIVRYNGRWSRPRRRWRRRRYHRPRRRYGRYRRYGRRRRRNNKYNNRRRRRRLSRRFGVPTLKRNATTKIVNKLVYKMSDEQNYPGEQLFFYPTVCLGNKNWMTSDTSSSPEGMLTNGFYRFDIFYNNLPPYSVYKIHNSATDKWTYYYKPNVLAWIPVVGAGECYKAATRLVQPYIVHAPTVAKTALEGLLQQYKFVKIRKLRIGVRLAHSYKNASEGAFVSDTKNVGESHGTSSQRVRIYKQFFRKEFDMEKWNIHDMSDADLFAFLGTTVANDVNDIFRLGGPSREANGAKIYLPSEATINDTAAVTTSAGSKTAKTMRFNPKLGLCKFSELPNTWSPFYGNSVKTIGEENRDVYAFPAKISSWYYHITMLYIPGEMSISNVTKPDLGAQYAFSSDSDEAKVTQVPCTSLPIASGYSANTTTSEIVVNINDRKRDPVVKLNVYYELVLWGPRRGLPATGVSVKMDSNGETYAINTIADEDLEQVVQDEPDVIIEEQNDKEETIN